MTSDLLSDAYAKYRHFVKQNVDLIGEVETALKWTSYFVSGRGSKETSSVLSELAYSASNVLSLVNDTIIRGSIGERSEEDEQTVDSEKTEHSQFFRLALTLIDYLEVFAEISSDRLWGTKGKWLIITVIQICKSALRLLLMLKHRCGILMSPPVRPLTVQQRKTFFDRQRIKRSDASSSSLPPSESEDSEAEVQREKTDGDRRQRSLGTFTLKRSGRVVRTISSAPPVTGRTWKLPAVLSNSAECAGEIVPTELSRAQVFGEMVHATRPLIHLLVRLSVGPQSWSQWLLACGMDVASLRLLGNHRQFNVRERGELRFRTLVLLHYILRSPFYDQFTKKRLIELLRAMSHRLPLARFICNPVMDFMPTWQKIYFYSWGS